MNFVNLFADLNPFKLWMLINRASGSTQNANKRGDNGHPCLIPHPSKKILERDCVRPQKH